MSCKTECPRRAVLGVSSPHVTRKEGQFYFHPARREERLQVSRSAAPRVLAQNNTAFCLLRSRWTSRFGLRVLEAPGFIGNLESPKKSTVQSSSHQLLD